MDFYIPRGLQGLQGIQGQSPVFSINSVTTVEWPFPAEILFNNTNPLFPQLDFKLPRGLQGVGNDGAKGDKGNNGDSTAATIAAGIAAAATLGALAAAVSASFAATAASASATAAAVSAADCTAKLTLIAPKVQWISTTPNIQSTKYNDTDFTSNVYIYPRNLSIIVPTVRLSNSTKVSNCFYKSN